MSETEWVECHPGGNENTHLRRSDYVVRTIPLAQAQELVREYHYSRGGANTATFRHGLFHIGDPETPLGVAWWIPPTKSAANATHPSNWRGVLALSRLVIVPGMPTNAASFLMASSIRLIRKDARWECLVTYADTWQGHTGAIYKATNWTYVGTTAPESVWVDPVTDRMVARKAGPKTRTRQEMLDLGYKHLGRFSKHKYAMWLGGGQGHPHHTEGDPTC